MIYDFKDFKNAELFNGVYKVKFIGKIFNTGFPTYIFKSHEEIYALEIDTKRCVCELEKIAYKHELEETMKYCSLGKNKLYNIELKIYDNEPHQFFSSNVITIQEDIELPFGDIEIKENFEKHDITVNNAAFLESIYDNKTLNEIIEKYSKEEKEEIKIKRATGYLGSRDHGWKIERR